LRDRLDLDAAAVNIAFNDSRAALHRGRVEVESDARFYRRRATEELAAANRAVTQAARERRMQLAQLFLDKLEGSDDALLFDWENGNLGSRERIAVP
jgi:hypothetical protein